MVDHLQGHKEGDVFPYVSVFGTQEESKDSRLSRLRAFRSPYGKETKPEMRINGVVLVDLEGTIRVQDLKDFVNKDQLNKEQRRENKRFRPLQEESFSKSYVQISRITGEFVPLMSSTSDYTELYFTLEDGRLLEHQVIAQSAKLPSNQNGVFELSCDYCINVKDLKQLSLKYFLSRPIMKEDFQWGSVSLTIRMSEADTPYVTSKLEAMAVVRTPFTTLEEQQKDPDHADVIYTSGQIKTFREMYMRGDIADIDEPKKEKKKISSYSKSSLRGTEKGTPGPSHLSDQEGWEHLKGMTKPLLPEGVASVSADSDGEDDIQADMSTREQYERHQEELRASFLREAAGSPETVDIPEEDLTRSPPSSSEATPEKPALLKPSLKKTRFAEVEGGGAPNIDSVFQYD